MPASASARVAGQLEEPLRAACPRRLRWVIQTAPSDVARQIAPVRCAMISPDCRAAPAQGAPRTDETPPPRSRRAPRDCPRPRGSCEPPHRCDQRPSRSRALPGSSMDAPGPSEPPPADQPALADSRRSRSRRSPPPAPRSRRAGPHAGTCCSCPLGASGSSRVAHTRPASNSPLAFSTVTPHTPLAELDRPVQRRRPTIPDRPRVHDQAPMLGPDRLAGSSSSRTGTRSATGRARATAASIAAAESTTATSTRWPKLGQRDPRALAQTVVSRDQEQDPRRSRGLLRIGPGGATCPGRSAEAGQVALGQEVLRLSVALCTVRFPC